MGYLGKGHGIFNPYDENELVVDEDTLHEIESRISLDDDEEPCILVTEDESQIISFGVEQTVSTGMQRPFEQTFIYPRILTSDNTPVYCMCLNKPCNNSIVQTNEVIHSEAFKRRIVEAFGSFTELNYDGYVSDIPLEVHYKDSVLTITGDDLGADVAKEIYFSHGKSQIVTNDGKVALYSDRNMSKIEDNQYKAIFGMVKTVDFQGGVQPQNVEISSLVNSVRRKME